MGDDAPASRIYLDTNVFIYALELSGGVGETCRSLLAALRQRPGVAVTSELTLAEATAPTPHAALPASLRRRRFVGLLVHQRFIRLEPVDRATLVETSRLREARPMRLPDAIHVVTAVRTGCSHVVSNDGRLRVPAPLRGVAVDGGALDNLVATLP